MGIYKDFKFLIQENQWSITANMKLVSKNYEAISESLLNSEIQTSNQIVQLTLGKKKKNIFFSAKI